MRLEDLAGQQFGRYTIVSLLGRGGMAAVYRAHDTALRRDVALKVLYPQYGGDTALVERFQREAVLAAQLDHPSIVPIYDVGEAGHLAYIAMKLLDGPSLADLLIQRGRLPLAELVPIVDQIAGALDYAHARGIVHRDIKPGNIILEGAGAGSLAPSVHAVLTDFGIAKSLDAPSMTGTGVLIGTPDYMAPEQIRGDHAIDGRADIYALGVVVYRCLTGRRPFEGGTQEVLIGHLQGSFPDPSALDPRLPQALDRVIRTAMARRPADRYQAASLFARELRAAAGMEPLTPPPAARSAADPRAVVPRVAAAELGQYAPDAPTRRGTPPRPANSATTRVAAETGARLPPAQPDAAPPRRRRTGLMIGAGLVLAALLVAELLIFLRPTGGIAGAPTPTLAAEPSAPPPPTATATPEATAVPTATDAPSPSVAPAPTETASPSPTLTPTATEVPPTLTPTLTPTQVPPTATDVPPTLVPTFTPTEVPPTLTPTATEVSPTLTPTLTPTPTPCAVRIVGGFGMLLAQNVAIRQRVGCPITPEQGGENTMAEQPFENGSMFYFQPTEEIYVLVGTESGAWQRFQQRELINLPTPTPSDPPGPGLFVPVRGFGLVWAYGEDVRRLLGYGTAPEAGLFEGAYQPFEGGALFYSGNGLGRGKTIYVLYADGTFERYDDPNQ